jgi:hypothetical protein
LWRTVSILTLALLASLAGSREATAAPSCERYPIPWRPPAGARASAQSELARLSPGASMTWNANTGTLTSASSLAVPLPSCTDGQDVIAQVYDVLAGHPALFQLDMSEWRKSEPFDCKYVGNDELLNMGRVRLAGRPVAQDVFAYSLKRINGVIHLTAVNGTYLPMVDAAMGETMVACNSLTESAATATARSTQLRATVLSNCSRTGTVMYMPHANDTFQLSPDEAWSWEEASAQALLTGQRTLRVIVNPANYTRDLMSSDARCPAEGDDNAFTVGFDIAFDVHTGAILSVKPGLDCFVC